jgi:hypothetical protein
LRLKYEDVPNGGKIVNLIRIIAECILTTPNIEAPTILIAIPTQMLIVPIGTLSDNLLIANRIFPIIQLYFKMTLVV